MARSGTKIPHQEVKPLVFVGREEGQFKKQREKREKTERGVRVETRVEEYLEIVRG